ncbi:MAG: nucleotidyltransferase family protein [Acidobacteria bacterium]|nr:nucleotidyltransferase family protein [Acidobacteriota bacterium]
MTSTVDVDVAVLVLAAGASTRFGSPKPLADVGGRPLLARAISEIQQWAPGKVVVVLGAEADLVCKVIPDDIEIVVCADWESGMSASLAAGIEAVAADPSIARCAVMMGDTLGVTASDAARVLEVSTMYPDIVMQATFEGEPSHPVVFPRELFDSLLELSGDSGARDLLASGNVDVVAVPLEASTPIDVDTRADLPDV